MIFSILRSLLSYFIGVIFITSVITQRFLHESKSLGVFEIILAIIGGKLIYSGVKGVVNTLKKRYQVIEYKELCNTKTIQNYIQKNADCYKHNQICCNKCGSKSISFQKFYGAQENILFSKYKAAIYNRHFCKQCANTLFYTPLNY